MKAFKYSLLIVLLAQGLLSCEKHLDRFPLDRITEADYWSTANDLKFYANQFYTSFPAHNGYTGGLFWGDNNSDNMIWGTYNQRLAGLSSVANSNGNFNTVSTQNWNYGNIRACNIAIENFHRIEASPAAVNKYKGEIYFFRAYYYYHLVKTYGDMPWVNKPLNIDDEALYVGRSPRTQVIDSVLADLDSAISMLPGKAAAEAQRLNRESALLFKSRVALFEGTWQKYHAGTPFGTQGADWQRYLREAAAAADTLITNNTVSLYKSSPPDKYFQELFGNFDYSAISEVLLWKKYDLELGVNHNLQGYIYSGGNTGPTKDFVEEFLCKDGLPISASPLYLGDDSTARLVIDRDPRLAQSIWVPGDFVSTGTTGPTYFTAAWLATSGEHKNVSGYQMKKGLTKRPEQGTNDRETAAIVFRYAEALLNFAEAKAELGAITQADLDKSVNALRGRAGMPALQMAAITPDPNWPFSGVSPLINEIRRERRVELAFEGFRFDDLCRWRGMSKIVGKRPLGAKFVARHYPTLVPGNSVLLNQQGYIDPYQKALVNGYGFKEDRDYLVPVPQLEITVNNLIGPNPGWQ